MSTSTAPAQLTVPGHAAAWLVAAGVLLGAVTELGVETPPSVLRGVVTAGSRGQLALDDAEGGLWSGSGMLSWLRAPRPPVPLGRWQWSATLVHGRPGWQLQSRSGALQGALAARPGLMSMSLDDVDLQISASALPTGLGPLDFLHAGGWLALQSPRIAARDGVFSGQGSLAWRQASTPLVALAALGSWRADWSLDADGARYVLTTERGPLHLEGRGHLGYDGHLSVLGRAWSEPASAGSLQPVLQLLGTRAPDGGVTVAIH